MAIAYDLRTESDKFVDEILKNRKLWLISPDYDDLGLSLFGTLTGLKDSGLEIEDVTIFSTSQYLTHRDDRTHTDNRNIGRRRTAIVSEIRKTEDETLMGLDLKVSILSPWGEKDGPLRGIPLTKVHGYLGCFSTKKTLVQDQLLHERLTESFEEIMSKEGYVLIPLAVNYHVNHIAVRRAALQAANNLYLRGELMADIAFYRDLPYCGLYDIKKNGRVTPQWRDAALIIEACSEPIDFAIDLIDKLKKVISAYKSQVNSKYSKGIRHDAVVIGRDHEGQHHERIYPLIKDNLPGLVQNLNNYF